MRPSMPNRVTIETPSGPPVVDPDSGDLVTPPPTVLHEVPARLSQDPVTNVGSQIELLANQQTLISMWKIHVPRNTPLNPDSVVTDEQGRKFRIEGAVADRPNHRPQFRVAAARLISDLQ